METETPEEREEFERLEKMESYASGGDGNYNNGIVLSDRGLSALASDLEKIDD